MFAEEIEFMRKTISIFFILIGISLVFLVYYFDFYGVKKRHFRTFTSAPIYSYELQRKYKLKHPVFVQGLCLVGHHLYTSSGLYGHSFLRVTNLYTGKILKKVKMRRDLFSEGITVFHHKLYQLFWKSGRGFIYDVPSLHKVGEFPVKGEGWGLTHNDRYLIMSNGSSTLYFLDPKHRFRVARKLEVYDGLRKIKNLNELHYGDNIIYANIWFLNDIAMINPKNGRVVGWINLSMLTSDVKDMSQDCSVANGITQNKENGNLIITGKCWKHLYEIKY